MKTLEEKKSNKEKKNGFIQDGNMSSDRSITAIIDVYNYKMKQSNKEVKEKLPKGQNNCCDNGNFGDGHRCLKIAPNNMKTLEEIKEAIRYYVPTLEGNRLIAGLKSTISQTKQELIEETEKILNKVLLDWEHIDGKKLTNKQQERFFLRDEIRRLLEKLSNK